MVYQYFRSGAQNRSVNELRQWWVKEIECDVGKLLQHSLDVLARQQSEREGAQIKLLFLADLLNKIKMRKGDQEK